MAYLLKPNIQYQGEVGGLIVLALIAGVVNGLIKPIVKLLSLPIRLATLGLFSLVINAGMLLLIAWLAGKVNIDFTIHGFPPTFSLDAVIWAIVGSIVLSIINTVIGFFVPD
jgi:putative membrane protein